MILPPHQKHTFAFLKNHIRKKKTPEMKKDNSITFDMYNAMCGWVCHNFLWISRHSLMLKIDVKVL